MATEPATDPRVERSRAAVLDAAVELLLEGGVPALTVEAVVERSGVARSTIYRHWATRRELLIAAFERLMPPVAEPDLRGTLAERLQTLMEARVATLRAATWAAAIPTMLEATSRDPELSGVRERLREQHRGPVRATLQAAIARGELPADTDIDEAVAQLAGPIVFRQLISGEPIDTRFGRRVVELFLASRRPAPSPQPPEPPGQ